MSLAKLLEARSSLKINQLLSFSSPKFLVIDDKCISIVGSLMQASLLTSLGYSSWSRLSKYEGTIDEIVDYSTIIVIADANTHYYITLFIADLVQRSITVDIIIAFMPVRRPSTVNRILANISTMCSSPPVAWEEKSMGTKLGNVSLQISDFDVSFYRTNRDYVYTLKQNNTLAQLNIHGDIHPINNLVNAIQLVLSYSHLCSTVSLTAAGEDSQSILSSIKQHITEITQKPAPSKASSFDKDYLHAQAALVLAGERPNSVNLLPGEVINQCILENASVDQVNDMVKGISIEKPECPCYDNAQGNLFSMQFPASGNTIVADTNKVMSIEKIIAIDRSFDWKSALLTPFTYEALIDLNWTISGNAINISPSILSDAQKAKNSKLVTVSIETPVHLELKSVEISEVADTIKLLAANHPSEDVPTTQIDAQAVARIHEVRMYNYNLKTHLDIATNLVKRIRGSTMFYTLLMIEDEILNELTNSNTVFDTIMGLAWHNAPLCDVLRLAVLATLVYNEKSETADKIKELYKVVSAVYGLDGVYIWNSLELLRLIQTSYYSKTKKLVNQLQHSFSHMNDVLHDTEIFDSLHSCCKMPMMNFLLQVLMDDTINEPFMESKKCSTTVISGDPLGQEKGSILLVFPHFITYSELAALDILRKHTQRDIIVIASQICGYRTFFNSLKMRIEGDDTDLQECGILASNQSHEYTLELMESLF